MNKKLLKLPILCLLGGLLMYLLIFIFIILGYEESWTPKMDVVLSYVPLAINIIILIVIGLILRRTYDRRDFFKAATLLVIYSILILLVQQIEASFDMATTAVDWFLHLPVALFGMTLPLSVKYNDTQSLSILFLIISILEPYLLVLFGKKSKNN